MRPCNGACCRHDWPVPVTAEEAPGYGENVNLTDAHGVKYVGDLKKKPGTTECVYLDAEGKCSIYPNRPSACKEWANDYECKYCWPE